MNKMNSELGLPGGTYLGLAISIPARAVVLGYAAAEDPKPIERLYVRGFDEQTYRQVAWLGQLNSYRKFAVSPTDPVLYSIATRWVGNAGWESSLVRVSLPDGAADVVSLPEGPHGRQWAADVLGFAGSGRELHLKVATERPLAEGHTRVEYGAYSFDLTSKELTLLTELPGIFG